MKPARPRTSHRHAVRAGPGRFDPVIIAAHWATVLLILGMFVSAWLYGQATDNDQATLLLTLHRSMGVAVWSVTAGRLVWRMFFGVIPPFPEKMPKLQQWIAKATEYGLYTLLLVQPLTGMAQSLTRGHPFSLFGLEVPVVMARDKGLTTLFHGIHEASAWALLGLICAHAGAALLHRFVIRDGVFEAMWPFRRRRIPRPHNLAPQRE